MRFTRLAQFLGAIFTGHPPISQGVRWQQSTLTILKYLTDVLPLNSDSRSEAHAKPNDRRQSHLDRRVVVLLAIILYSLGALLSQNRSLDPNEFMHLHISWLIFNGMISYAYFFCSSHVMTEKD
jgi:hypothetical protein